MANLKSAKPQYNDPLLQSLQYNELFIFLYPCYRKTYEMESRYNETVKQTLFYLSLGPLLLWGSTVREQNQINSGSFSRMSSLWNSPFACAMWMDPFSHENWKVWSRKCFCPSPPPHTLTGFQCKVKPLQNAHLGVWDRWLFTKN